ncbi:hydroxyacylglutathione hydrolase [Cellvibrio sp. UBA7661]|uniref:hydroxyacylglutathione hydrolase n=1 Tax=Cellvibrio sp. UBA7661 TaxID=1946311 RepID=UPI002F350871
MITITPIPALDSNYFWIIRPRTDDTNVYVVDPGDAAVVIHYLHKHHLQLAGILVTHRHRDHTQGIPGLLQYRDVPVYGPEAESIPWITHFVSGGEQLRLDGIQFSIIAVPGHTWEHIAYLAYDAETPLLFCGDALFAGGCGRRFDGTAEVMWRSLMKLASLPDNTLIYCAHEYTEANLEFALAVEPDNKELEQRLVQVKKIRSQQAITLPSTILMEKRTNPFLRCQQAGIKSFVENRLGQTCETAADVFGGLRLIKDHWPDQIK